MRRIVWTFVDIKNIFHGCYDSRVRFGRDDPLLVEMRLENVFWLI
jgi:hypothetical protein